MKFNPCETTRWHSKEWIVAVILDPDEQDDSWLMSVNRYGKPTTIAARLTGVTIRLLNNGEVSITAHLRGLKKDGTPTARDEDYPYFQRGHRFWDKLPIEIQRAHDAFVAEVPGLLAEAERVNKEIERLKSGLADWHRISFEARLKELRLSDESAK